MALAVDAALPPRAVALPTTVITPLPSTEAEATYLVAETEHTPGNTEDTSGVLAVCTASLTAARHDEAAKIISETLVRMVCSWYAGMARAASRPTMATTTQAAAISRP